LRHIHAQGKTRFVVALKDPGEAEYRFLKAWSAASASFQVGFVF
jgi:hypothetical protein